MHFGYAKNPLILCLILNLIMFNTNNDPFNSIDLDNNINTNPNACRYFTIGEFNSNFEENKDNYFLVNQNLQSFSSKSSIFEAFLGALSFLPDTMVLSETWNDPNSVSLCNIDNFDAKHTHREWPENRRHHGGIGGGVSIFANSSIYGIKKINNLSFYNESIETCVARIHRLDNKDDEHYIVGVYRPRHDNDENFINTLHQILSSEVLRNKTIILAGDMNIDLLKPNENYVNEYLCMLNSLHFTPIINKATRFPNGINSSYNPSSLDHIFINKIVQYVGPIFLCDISDHCGSALHFKNSDNSGPVNNDKKISFRLYNEQNSSKFETKITQTDWDFILDIDDVNIQFHAFFNYVNSVYKECFPIKTKSITDKRKNNPWITESTRTKIKLKSDYYKQYRNGLISRETNNRMKNKLNKEINKDKKLYYNNVFSDSNISSKKAWNTLHSLLGTNNKKNISDKIFANATTDLDKLQTVNYFNDYFANVGSTLASQLQDSMDSPILQSDYNPHSFYLFPPSHLEISKIIMNLKNTWTPMDVLPVKVLKEFSQILAVPITKIIENSILKGVFPEYLKVARITPIHKEDSYLEPSNFRPISSLFYLSKIYEKFFSNRLIKYCDKYSLITTKQYGFQHGKSTADALISLTEEIYSALDNKFHFLAAIIDVKMAFDCVNHNMLLAKLERYGVRGLPLKWLASYLSDRQCYVEIGSYKSNLNTFNIGVPQGSILGPLLFLLYINNLPKFSDTLQTQLFADDTIVSNTGPNIDVLINSTNLELSKLKEWTQANKLTIHAGKTKFLVVTKKIIPETFNLTIRFFDSVIHPTDNCKYLGVFLDNKLTFVNHIKFINSKISRHTGILYKIRDNLPIKARLDFYYAYICPYLSYCTIIWGSTYDIHLQPLIIQQKRTIRTITNAGYNAHTKPLFKQLNLLTLENIYRFQLGIYMYHARSRDEYPTQSAYPTRGFNRALPEYHRIPITQHALSHKGPTFWNTLPQELRAINNYKRFRSSLKEYLLEEY